MADINRELEETAELTRQVNQEFAMFGQLTQDTSKKLFDSQMKTKYGFDNATAAIDNGAKSIQALGRAAKEAGSAALEGSKKASSMNGAFGELTSAVKLAINGLSLLVPGGPLIKGISFALSLVAGKALDAADKYREVAVKISDQLYEGYSALAESGAAASDGMTGLFEDAKKLGYSMGELAQYTQLIGENSKDLALFGGTVFEGRKQFAEMGKSFEKYSDGLIAAGFTQTQINEGMMGYIKLQSKAGQSQNKTADQLADGARKYLLEMDGLAKLTGQSRKEMEAQRERQLLNEQFAAKIRELQLRGGPEAEAAAERLKAMGNMAARMGPEMEEAFLASVTGNFANAKAIGANIASQNELMKTIGMVEKGLLTPAEAMQRTAKAMGKFGDSMNGLAQVNAFESAFGIKYATVQQARLLAEGDIVENLNKAEAERKKQGAEGGKAADDAVAAQVNFQREMRKANEQIERFFVPGMATATNAAAKFASSVEGVADRMNKLFGITPTGTKPSVPEGPKTTLDQAKKELDASTERAKLAGERAAAAEKDANLTRAEKDRIKKEARESEAAVMQDVFRQREAQLREQNARRAARRAGTAAPTSAAPVSVSPAAPTSAAPAGGGSSAPAAPAANTAAPTTGFDGKPNKGGATEGTAESGVQTGSEVKIGNEIRKGGTVSWRTNNPGNISYAGITRKHGAIGAWKKPDGDEQQRTAGIAIMPSLEAGENVQMDQWRRPSYIDLSIDQAVNRWTGQHAGLGSTYAKDLAKAAGVDLGTAVRELSDDQLRKLVKKQAVWEGFKPGQVVQAADGGMFSGPKSGYPATLHGTEAVIPLKNGAVPVSLSMTDVLGGLSDDISEQLKEIKDQTVSANDTALRQVTSEFKTAMAQLSQQLSENAKMQNQDNMSGIYALMEELVSATKNGVDVQQKILATNY